MRYIPICWAIPKRLHSLLMAPCLQEANRTAQRPSARKAALEEHRAVLQAALQSQSSAESTTSPLAVPTAPAHPAAPTLPCSVAGSCGSGPAAAAGRAAALLPGCACGAMRSAAVGAYTALGGAYYAAGAVTGVVGAVVRSFGLV